MAHPDARLHHSFGIWPAVLNDTTTMIHWDPPHQAVLQPRGWPLGEARVTITVEPHRHGCRVTITENPVRGPGAGIPGPIIQPLLYARNIETLHRLAFLAEGQHRHTQTAELSPTAPNPAALPPKTNH